MPVALPTKAEFQKATDLTMVRTGKRSGDKLLLHVDELLDLYQTLGGAEKAMRVATLGRLYFTIDRWIMRADRGTDETINARRKPGVQALYVKVVQGLVEETGWTVNVLPRWLSETFGRAMVDHGVEVDLENRSANYEVDREKYRITFRGGLAYQKDWWATGNNLVQANTETINPVRTVISAMFCGYVVNQMGEFFIGPHASGSPQKQNGFYHSSYLKGEPVMCAGEIRIREGKVLSINNDSGHYRPSKKNVAMAVETLEGYGVDLDTLKVSGHGIPEVTGRAFMRQFDAAVGTGDFAFSPSGPSAMEKAQVKYTLQAHASATQLRATLELLKSHWVSRPGMKPPSPGHGRPGRDKCPVCKGNESHWGTLERMVRDAGGIDRVVIPAVGPAIVGMP